MDMHSGGGQKEDYPYIYIEAPEEEAKVIFYNRFGHNPERVTCTCCGNDYSISSNRSLEQLTAYDRSCDYCYFDPDGNECNEKDAWVFGKGFKPGYYSGYAERKNSKYSWKDYQTLEEYKNSGETLFIYEKDILPNERLGEIPTQGYVWL